ncbi:MAG: hypothetical protein AB7Q69_07855, partial [Gemmatimonadales bacterium]
YGKGETVVRAFLAGADLLLMPSDPDTAIDAMVRAVESGRIPCPRLEASVKRVLLLKRDIGLFRRRTVLLDSIPDIVGSAGFKAVAADIAVRSIVLARDSTGLVRAMRRGPRPVTIVSLGDDAGNTLAGELRTAGYQVTTFRLYPPSGPASYDSARVALASSRTAIFVASVRASAWAGNIALPPPFAALVDSTARRQPTVLVSLGSPYIIGQAPGAWSYILGWSARAASERAVAGALTGQTSITGRLPISIPPYFQRGDGIRLVSGD